MEFLGEVKDGMEPENYEDDDFAIMDDAAMAELEAAISHEFEELAVQGMIEEELLKSVMLQESDRVGQEEEKSKVEETGISVSDAASFNNSNIDPKPSPQIKTLELVENIMGESVALRIVALSGSAYIWCAPARAGAPAAAAAMGPLVCAMNTRFDSMPIVTTLIQSQSSGDDDSGVSMAQRLSKKTGLVCFVSCNIDHSIELLLPNVEKRIVQLLTKFQLVEEEEKSAANIQIKGGDQEQERI